MCIQNFISYKYINLPKIHIASNLHNSLIRQNISSSQTILSIKCIIHILVSEPINPIIICFSVFSVYMSANIFPGLSSNSYALNDFFLFFLCILFPTTQPVMKFYIAFYITYLVSVPSCFTNLFYICVFSIQGKVLHFDY